MVGTSWFYDPALPAISPRLAYLQQRPLEAGAFLVRHGRGAIYTERATLTSETRRKLYEEGKYLPVCFSLVWPRDALIAWAERSGRDSAPFVWSSVLVAATAASMRARSSAVSGIPGFSERTSAAVASLAASSASPWRW